MEIPVKKTKRIPDIPSVNGTNLQENGIVDLYSFFSKIEELLGVTI